MVTPPLGMLGHSALSGAFRSVYNISGRLKARQKLAGTEDLSSLVLMYAQFDPSVQGHDFAKLLALSWRQVEAVFPDFKKDREVRDAVAATTKREDEPFPKLGCWQSTTSRPRGSASRARLPADHPSYALETVELGDL